MLTKDPSDRDSPAGSAIGYGNGLFELGDCRFRALVRGFEGCGNRFVTEVLVGPASRAQDPGQVCGSDQHLPRL
jgi:hypothetical protein